MADDTSETTRRDLLAGGGALAGAAVSGSTAGCLSLLPPVGQEVRYGRVDTPGPADGEPTYRRWMPAEDALPEVENPPDVADMHWVSVTPGNLGMDEPGAEFRIGAAVVMTALDYFGYGFEHYDNVYGLGSLGAVAEGDIDTSAVTETLEESGYKRDGTYHGWELFDRTDIPRTVAVSGEAIVQTNGGKRRTFIETLLDAGDGRIDRRHEHDEQFRSFSEWVGSYPTLLEGFGGGFTDPGPDESVLAYTFDEDAAYYLYLQQYADGETPAKGEIQHALEDSIERAMQAWAVDIEVDEPHVAVEMRVDKAEFKDDFVEDRTPYLTWGVDDGEETVTIRHEAGESVPLDQVDIEPEAALQDRQETGGALEPGDALTFTLAAFPDGVEQISLVYNYAGTEHDTAALLHYTPDEFDTDE
jgi:hypothetical protein